MRLAGHANRPGLKLSNCAPGLATRTSRPALVAQGLAQAIGRTVGRHLRRTIGGAEKPWLGLTAERLQHPQSSFAPASDKKS